MRKTLDNMRKKHYDILRKVLYNRKQKVMILAN